MLESLKKKSLKDCVITGDELHDLIKAMTIINKIVDRAVSD